jgi:hypothetical protein
VPLFLHAEHILFLSHLVRFSLHTIHEYDILALFLLIGGVSELSKSMMAGLKEQEKKREEKEECKGLF